MQQLEEIATTKMPDLTAADMDAAVRTIAGTARSMGIDVQGSLSNGQSFSKRRKGCARKSGYRFRGLRMAESMKRLKLVKEMASVEISRERSMFR